MINIYVILCYLSFERNNNTTIGELDAHITIITMINKLSATKFAKGINPLIALYKAIGIYNINIYLYIQLFIIQLIYINWYI